MKQLLSRAVVATAFGALAAAPLAAQSNSFVAGTTFTSPSLTGIATGGSQMIGMLVTWTWANGTSNSASWANLNNTSCGVASGGLTVAFGCAGDTFDGVTRWVIANGSGQALSSVRFNGAPGRTLFDCAWTGSACANTGKSAFETGTPNSARGWSHERAGGDFSGEVFGVYSNQVGVAGNAPVGDLFEQLTISFGGGMGSNTYEFYADTDNSSSQGPPPTSVPEPTSLALLGLGVAGLVAARRRRV